MSTDETEQARNVFESKPWLASYAPGVPATIEQAEESLVDMIDDSVARFSNGVALEFFGATTTYRELGDQIARASEGLRKLGVKAGDRVAIVLPNCPQHIVAYYAALRIGAVVVEHNPLYTDRELLHQFEDHGAATAIVWDKVAASVVGFPASMGVTGVISVDITRAMPLGTRMALRLPIAKARAARNKLTLGKPAARAIVWESLLKNAPLRADHPRPAASDTAVLQYTSGTTGSPKGAILSHQNLRVNAAQGQAWLPGMRAGKEVFHGVLPMFHAFGLTLCLTFAMSMGARLVLFPAFDEKLVLTAARKNPPTFFPAVPPIYDRLVKAAAAAGVSLASVRFAISGAMALPVATVEAWESATGGFLIEGYGMTEASPIIAGNPASSARRAGAVGLPFPGTEIRVVDPDEPTVDRGFDAAGELLVRGPQVFSGYWNRPNETAETLLAGGWLRTGDIVTVSPDGFITIIDRLKELIITGGFNVAPSEVEAALMAHPSIADVAVVGVPDAGGSEVITAVVVLEAGASLELDELRTFGKTRLAAYKVPRALTIVDELPRSLIGKVLRKKVRELLED